MAKIDVAKTAFAGFGVIGRNPAAVLVWGLLLAACALLPFLLMMSSFTAMFADLSTADPNAAPPSPDAMMPMMSVMMLLQPVLILLSIAQQAVLGGAVIRAVLEPNDRRWFYLRFGAQELWLALVSVVFFVLTMVASMVLGVVAVPLMFVGMISSPDDVGTASLIMIPFLIAACLGFLWLTVRFSLAFPMTFAERQFRLFESWTLTRGHGGSLFLIALILIALLTALYVLLVLVIGAVVVAGAGIASGGFNTAAIESYFNQDPQSLFTAIMPWVLIGSVGGYIVVAAMMAVLLAPWAEAYRQLRDQTPSAEPAITA